MSFKNVVAKRDIKAQLPTIAEFFDYGQELVNLWNQSARPSTYERKLTEAFLS